MRILLIGGTGTISTAITALLAKRGTDKVWVLNRGNRADSLPEGICQIVANAYDKEDFEKAIELYGYASYAGYFPATIKLGQIYDPYYGAGEDEKGAREEYLQAAENGSLDGQAEIAKLDFDQQINHIQSTYLQNS